MIIGPPRSGSTIIYQVLIRAIQCVYISNLHSLFPKSASSYLLKKDLFGKNIGGFNNYYGYTSSIYDVSEGNQIIEAILSDKSDQKLIRKKFIAFINMMFANREKPLIIKNVRAYSSIADLHKAVPEIIFLRVRRNPEQIIQSVLCAFHELGYFHPIPHTLKDYKTDDPLEFGVRQILEIDKEIDKQKSQISESKWLELWYEDFCADPWSIINYLAENYFDMDLPILDKTTIPELKVSKRIKVNDDEANRISYLIQKYSSSHQ